MCTGAEVALAAGVMKGGGGILGGFQASSEASKISTQIKDQAKATLKQTARQQEARRGAMRTAYAKAGVKRTGTAKLTLDEQIYQDELMLNEIANNAIRSIKKTSRAGRHAMYKGAIGGAGQIASSAINFTG